jgi:hypothetical protein
MKTTVIRRALAVLLCLGLLLGALGMTACANKGTPLLTLDDHTISVNQYQFLLSRVKGSLGYAGYNVESSSFWDMIIDENNTTYDAYFKNAALDDARRYLAALAIFEERGLSLPQATLDKIDQEIEDYIEDAGGKSALNSKLGTYGINVDMLKDLYIIEAKYTYLKDTVYGPKGELLAAEARLAYVKEYGVAFRQVLIRAFDYVYEKDLNGDDIYYLSNENNAKVNNIAYDKEAGDVRLDEFGKIVTDKNGDDVYYLANGKIAYDKENGVRAYTYDENGQIKTEKYSAEVLAEHKAAAEEMMASIEKGDYLAFEALLEEYEISGDDAFVTDGELGFLYTTGDNNYDYLNDIADALAACDEGEIRMISSEYGYNVVMKYAIPDDAITNADYKDWFGDLTTRVIAKQFHTLCKPYMEKVQLDEEAFASLPSMKEVASNLDY